MDKEKKYESLTDLLMEPSFLAWYLKKNALYEQAWDKWIANNPLHESLAEEASEVLAVLVNLERQPVSNYQRNVSFNRLLQKINEKEKKIVTTASSNNFLAD